MLLLTAPLLAWVLMITPLHPSAPSQPSQRFDTPEACTAAMNDFIEKHMTTNWQGLKMSPLVRAKCSYRD